MKSCKIVNILDNILKFIFSIIYIGRKLRVLHEQVPYFILYLCLYHVQKHCII